MTKLTSEINSSLLFKQLPKINVCQLIASKNLKKSCSISRPPPNGNIHLNIPPFLHVITLLANINIDIKLIKMISHEKLSPNHCILFPKKSLLDPVLGTFRRSEIKSKDKNKLQLINGFLQKSNASDICRLRRLMNLIEQGRVNREKQGNTPILKLVPTQKQF